MPCIVSSTDFESSGSVLSWGSGKQYCRQACASKCFKESTITVIPNTFKGFREGPKNIEYKLVWWLVLETFTSKYWLGELLRRFSADIFVGSGSSKIRVISSSSANCQILPIFTDFYEDQAMWTTSWVVSYNFKYWGRKSWELVKVLNMSIETQTWKPIWSPGRLSP